MIRSARSIVLVPARMLWLLWMLWMPATAPLHAAPWMSATATLAAQEADQFRPAVAYSPDHDEYLVVWQADVAGISQIHGVRVDGDGQPVGVPFAISDSATDQLQPDVAYDPVADRYLVVWVSDYSGDLSDTDIAARFVPWNGPDEGLAVFGVYGATSGQWSPAVVHNPGVDEFLVVWGNVEAGSPSSISFQRWAADGAGAVTSALTIPGGDEHRVNPQVAWNPVTAQYLVVYERYEGAAEEDVYGTRLTWSGSILGAEIGIAGWPDEESQAAVASCRGAWLVAWKGGIGTASKVYARTLDGDGTVESVRDLSDTTSDDHRPVVACNEGGDHYLVAWETPVDGHRNVDGAVLGGDGVVAERFPIYRITAGNLDYSTPAVAASDHGRALVVWESDRPDLTSQDVRGRLVGEALLVDGFESGDETAWSDPS